MRATDRYAAQNRRARFDYLIEDKLEAGLVLHGTEVKVLRQGGASIAEAYADEKSGELYLVNANIPEYKASKHFNHEPRRPRKLLLHRKEVNRLLGAIRREGVTVEPVAQCPEPGGAGSQTFDSPIVIIPHDGSGQAVVTAGVHRASSIKVAEAAKVIENTQRDLNIALVNELALIFNKIGIDTTEVLEAAGTKWNFLPFRPGLVGGHCIGVDPYYLTYKAETLGYHPQVILSGRKINDGMGKYVAEQTVKRMILRGFCVNKENVIVLGLTFKENVPDTRNSRVVDVVRELESFGAKVYVHDPIACPKEAEHEYGIRLTKWEELPQAAAIVAAVAHDEYRNRPLDTLVSKLAPNGVYVDVKNRADAAALRDRGIEVWRL